MREAQRMPEGRLVSIPRTFYPHGYISFVILETSHLQGTQPNFATAVLDPIKLPVPALFLPS
jgi:hypothetical protein